MRMVSLVCAVCGKTHEKRVGHYNAAIRAGQTEFFCSTDCLALRRTVRIDVACALCGKTVSRRPKEIEESGLSFCDKSCAASYHNKDRDAAFYARLSATLKGRVFGDQVKRELRICPVCNKEYKYNHKTQKACSPTCRFIYDFGHLPLTKEEVLNQIQAFQGTPSSKEVSWILTHAAARFFGTWNKAVIAAGLEPNVPWVQRKVIACTDGHRADSLSERIIDDWLYNHGIEHERFKAYPVGRYTCDFYLPKQDLWVEYFGLIGHRDYNATVDIKRKIFIDYNLKCLEILPEHLYPKNNLVDLFGSVGVVCS